MKGEFAMNNLRPIGVAEDGLSVILGEDVFRLKDEIGLPLSVCFAEFEKRGMMIDWIGFINAARKSGWWDFQAIEAIEEAFADSQAWADKRTIIMLKIKAYVMAVAHPRL